MRDKWKRTQKIRFGGEWPRRQPLSWEHQIELANIYEARDPQFVEAARRYRAREGLRKNQHAPLRDDFVQGLRGLYQRGHVWPSFIKDRYGVAQYNLNNELVSRNIQLYAITKNNGDQGTSRGFEIAKQELLGHLERREVGGSPLPAKVPSPPSSPEPEHTIGEGPSTSAGGRSQLPKRPMPVLPTTQEEEESRRIVEEFLELPPAADQPSGSGLGQIPDPPNVAPPSPKRKRKRPPADQQPSHSGALPTSSGEGSSSGHGQGTSGGRNHPPAHSSPGERSAQPPHRGGIIPSLPPRSNPADLLPGPSNVMPEGRRGRSRSGSPSRSLSTPGVSPSAKRANRGPMGRRRRKRNAQSA